MNILSLDFGTSSIKACVLDLDQQILASARASYDYHVYAGDQVVLEPADLEQGLAQCLRQLQPFLKQVRVIAYCTFSPSLVMMDADGQALYPVITHLDRRSKQQTRQIIKQIGKKPFQQITGVLPFTGGVSVTSLLWLKQHESDLFRRTARIGHLNTYIYKRLTGQWATDPTNASMMGLYETRKSGDWSSDICKELAIPAAMLPDIYPAGTILGRLQHEFAAVHGLMPDIPVVLGSNDAATAQIGAGNTHSGDLLNIAGSSDMISILTSQPVIHDAYYLRKAITPGLWQIYATTTAGFVLEWFRCELCPDLEQSVFYHDFLTEAVSQIGKSPVKFHPYMTGDRHSLRKKRGAFTGLTLDTRRVDLLAAMLLGIQQPLRQTIDISRQIIPLSDTLKLTGGLAADAYVDLKRSQFPEFRLELYDDCPLLGNSRLALAALSGNGPGT